MVGRSMSVQEVMREIERDIVFYDQSGGGVTFTGGEPMWQREFLHESLAACKDLGIHTAVDTSGYTSWGELEAIVPLTKLFLYDLKLMDEARHIQYTSVPNQLILGNLRKLSEAGAQIIVRMPLIPGINDDKENIVASAIFLASLPELEGVELMPYHKIGQEKYQSLGMKYQLDDVLPPSRQKIEEVERILSDYKLAVIKHVTGRTQ